MEDIACSQTAEELKTQIASCESEVSALAREALNPATLAARRVEALILRAELQTRIGVLTQDLQRLRSESPESDRARKCKAVQSGPWPHFD